MCVAAANLEQTSAYDHILVSAIGQERDRGAGAERAEFHHMNVVLTGHSVSRSTVRVLLHAVYPSKAGFRAELL